MKKRGSAIIIAMLLIAAIGSIAFGIGRLLFIESTSAAYYVNGAVAYYAAESGLEEGFLRYRYNQNSEVPFSSWILLNKNVYRSNLSDNALVSTSGSAGDSPSNAITSVAKQYYDLRMGYLGTYGQAWNFHDVNNNGFAEVADAFSANYDTDQTSQGGKDYTFLKVPKDESKKFDITNLNLNNANTALTVSFKFKNVNNNGYSLSDQCKAMAEVKFVIKDSSDNVREYKTLIVYNADVCSSVLGISRNNLKTSWFPAGGRSNAVSSAHGASDTDYYYSDNNLLNEVLSDAGAVMPAGYKKAEMYIKPLYYDADIGFMSLICNAPNACLGDRGNIVEGPFSSINTTGYYGGVARKLEANIDRQSGTLYDLFDYVIYKAT